MGKNEKKMILIAQTYHDGFYKTETSAAAPQSIISMLSRLTGSTVQYVTELDGYHALIVSRVGGNTSEERGGTDKYALLFGEGFAEQLMRRPAAVFKVADWLLEMGDATSLNKLTSLLDELDDSRYCDNMPFTDGMLTAYAVALAVSMNGKNLCFVDDLSKDGLLAVLYALPPSLRGKISFSYGYCKACPATLRLIARNATDPKFEVPPSQMAYTTSDIETILTEILDVKQEALTAVIGEGVSPHAVTWTPSLLLEVASWQPAAAPQRDTASAPVAHPRERQQPRERSRGEHATLVRRNAALSLTRKLLLLLFTAVLLFYGFRTGTSVIGDGVYLRLYLNLSMGDLVRAIAVFAAGWLARSLVKRK
mgnify:FL=1